MIQRTKFFQNKKEKHSKTFETWKMGLGHGQTVFRSTPQRPPHHTQWDQRPPAHGWHIPSLRKCSMLWITLVWSGRGLRCLLAQLTPSTSDKRRNKSRRAQEFASHLKRGEFRVQCLAVFYPCPWFPIGNESTRDNWIRAALLTVYKRMNGAAHSVK